MRLQLKIQTVTREPMVDDDALGEHLVSLVRQAVPKRAAPAAATIARAERIELIALRPLAEQRLHVNGFIASLTRARVEPDAGVAEAVGVIGTLGTHGGVPVAAVFLEWPDNRWWLWRAVIDPTDWTLKGDTETVTRAVDGDPMPAGLGRWWALGRRNNLTARIRRQEPVVH